MTSHVGAKLASGYESNRSKGTLNNVLEKLEALYFRKC